MLTIPREVSQVQPGGRYLCHGERGWGRDSGSRCAGDKSAGDDSTAREPSVAVLQLPAPGENAVMVSQLFERSKNVEVVKAEDGERNEADGGEGGSGAYSNTSQMPCKQGTNILQSHPSVNNRNMHNTNPWYYGYMHEIHSEQADT